MTSLTFETKVWQSVAKSPSLRTSVPRTIAELLELEKEGTLVWTYDAKSRSVNVTKAKASPKKK